MAVELEEAYVPIIPSLRGFSQRLRAELYGLASAVLALTASPVLTGASLAAEAFTALLWNIATVSYRQRQRQPTQDRVAPEIGQPFAQGRAKGGRGGTGRRGQPQAQQPVQPRQSTK